MKKVFSFNFDVDVMRQYDELLSKSRLKGRVLQSMIRKYCGDNAFRDEIDKAVKDER